MHTRFDAFLIAVGLLAAGVLAVTWLVPVVRSAHAASVTVSISPAPAASPAPPAEASDPVVGPWLLEGRSLLTLAADHRVSGDRHGAWRYTCTTSGGRNYEVHWQLPKDWVDYMVLSEDGKRLDGKTRHDGHIVYIRP